MILGHFNSTLSPVSITATEIKNIEEQKSSIKETDVDVNKPFIE